MKRNMNKSLKELSWQCSEEEYRNHPFISYSKISKFIKEGAKSLIDTTTLDTEPLRFGSLVDILLTEPDRLYDKFYITDAKIPSDTIASIVKGLYNIIENKTKSLISISKEDILSMAEQEGYGRTWKPDTVYNKIIEEGKEYYNTLLNSDNKIIMSTSDLLLAQECVDVLKTHAHTYDLVSQDPFSTNVEHLYQLKFVNEEYGIRCMFDKIIVDHNNKKITPIDIKTTGKSEDLFENSFEEWNYFIQASMYYYILSESCKKDEYFKDFQILPFTFICINRYNKCPVCWKFDWCDDAWKEITFNDGKVFKHWKTYLADIKWHIQNEIYYCSKETYTLKGKRTLCNYKIRS